MTGTISGGKKCAATIKRLFGSDKIGPDGLTGRERARIAGAKGSRVSKRGESRKEQK